MWKLIFNNCMQVFTERKLSAGAKSDDSSMEGAAPTKPIIPDGNTPLKVNYSD